MITLDVMTERQIDGNRIVEYALLRKSFFYGCITADLAKDVLECGSAKARRVLDELVEDGVMTKQGALYWVKDR